jgi:tetratricopeptide (TPR) repeat protein
MKATSSQANGKSTRRGSGVARWARGRKRNAKSRTGSSAEPAHQAALSRGIEAALRKRRWSLARKLLLESLETAPDDHWLLTMIGLTYYEEHDYAAAYEWCLKAIAQQPDCPLVLFHYAGTLEMLGRVEQALGVYQQILGRDYGDLVDGPCGEGEAWALQLLNDCHYRMGRCYQSLGELKEAQLSLLKYLHNLHHGAGTIYGKAKAEAALAEITRGHHPALQHL